MSIEETLRSVVASEIAAFRAELAAIKSELRELRRALPPLLVTKAHVAKVTGWSLKTVQRRIAEGTLRTVGRGTGLRIDLASLHQPELAEVVDMATKARRTG